MISTDDSNYILKYPNALLAKSFSRQKRGLITSPLGSTLLISPLEMGLKILGFSDNALIKSALDLINFGNDMLFNRTDLCSKSITSVEKLSINLAEMMLHPIQTIKDILCYIFNAIGNEGRAIVLAITPHLSKFFFRMILPGLHTILNSLAKTGLLPENLKVWINMFNVSYDLLKILGYVS